MIIVPRFFKQLRPENNDDTNSETFQHFLDRTVVVILGDPGIGKTTEIEQAAQKEGIENAAFCTVSEFLNSPVEIYQGKTIYMDALDEHRAEGNSGQTVINRGLSR